MIEKENINVKDWSQTIQEHKIKQKQIADMIGLSTVQLNKILKGKVKKPRSSTTIAIEVAIRCLTSKK